MLGYVSAVGRVCVFGQLWQQEQEQVEQSTSAQGTHEWLSQPKPHIIFIEHMTPSAGNLRVGAWKEAGRRESGLSCELQLEMVGFKVLIEMTAVHYTPKSKFFNTQTLSLQQACSSAHSSNMFVVWWHCCLTNIHQWLRSESLWLVDGNIVCLF